MSVTEEPHWERGYRVHGYWSGLTRLGYVGLPMGKRGIAIAKYGYSWGLDLQGGPVDMKAKTLRAAKKAVEKAYRKWLLGKGP